MSITSERLETEHSESAVPDNVLTEQEQKWLERLAKVMASGYGADRGRKPTHVRSGVYRGALATLLPLAAEFAPELQEGSELTQLGVESMRAALTKYRFLPLP